MPKLHPEYFSHLRKSFWKHPRRSIIDDNKAIKILSKNGELQRARQVFDTMPERTVVSWNAMIMGYSKSNMILDSLYLFSLMRRSNFDFDETTYTVALSICGREQFLRGGKQIHGLVFKSGHLRFEFVGSTLLHVYASCCQIGDGRRVFDELHEENELLWSSMLQFYVKCNLMSDAHKVFDKMPSRNVSDWNMMISVYAKKWLGPDPVFLFRNMLEEGIIPDAKTFAVVLCTCARLGSIQQGQILHAHLVKTPFLDVYNGTALVDMYSKCGSIANARMAFNCIFCPNVGAWTAMIHGLSNHGLGLDAVFLFRKMLEEGIIPDAKIFTSVLSACACLGSIHQGQIIHGRLVKTPFSFDGYNGTALVDMYSKCGSIANARVAFSCIFCPNVAAWTAMIHGFSNHGLGPDAVSLFSDMLEEDIIPDATTFIAVLSACARDGLVEDGMRIFRSMNKEYDITPKLEHYNCVVDLLCKSGFVHEAEQLIEKMPIEPNEFLLTTLLHACWLLMETELAEKVARKLFRLDPKSRQACVIMSNVYAGSGNREQESKIRNCLKNSGSKDIASSSWIISNA